MLTPSDLAQLSAKGITQEQVMEQLECFRKGFPYLKLHAAAAVPDDILALTPESQEQYVQNMFGIEKEGQDQITLKPGGINERNS